LILSLLNLYGITSNVLMCC